MKKEKIKVEGMTCASCQAHVDKAIKKLDGVKSVNVNLLGGNAVVEFDENNCSLDTIISAVNSIGYKASSENNKQVVEVKEKSYTLHKLIASIVLLLILMYFSMGNMMWGWPSPDVFDCMKNPMGFSLLQFILVLPIVYINKRYFISGFKKLFKGAPNMDTLIAIGSSVSIIYGIFCLFMISLHHHEYHNYLYFESAGMILVFVSIGKYLEELSKKKTTSALNKLYDLAPKTAIAFKDGKEVEIQASDINVDDILVVKKGMKVPTDGIIIEGGGALDESNLTGESIPPYKTKDEMVYSSTILTQGYFKMKALKKTEDTRFAGIIRLVDEASNSKAPISRLADRISAIFVPTILIIALITFIVNFIYVSITHVYDNNAFELSLNFAITVIVIACPCALGLATPVAIMVGIGKGAQCGLLIKNASVLENTSHIKYAVMDKTGTITEGRPRVVDYINVGSVDIKNEIYSIEAMSEHPLALGIVEYLKGASSLTVENFTAINGEGLSATIDGVSYYIGNKKMLTNLNIDYSSITDILNKAANEGKTCLIAVRNNEISAIIAIRDNVKETSKEAISLLEKQGIKTVMLTGDNLLTANAISKLVGVDEVIAEVLPEGKAEAIRSIKKKTDGLVVMIGDGVNDAIALKEADLGYSIGGGSDVAKETSDIILLSDDLLSVVDAINLSKKTVNTIKLGLFWAFFYNLICVVLATGIFYYLSGGSFKMEPMYGSIAMSLSSVSVVLNALSINLFKPKRKNIKKEEEVIKMTTYVINVDGMMCKHCKMHVEEACKSVNGVVDAVVSLEDKNVTVTATELGLKEQLEKAITNAGYDVK